VYGGKFASFSTSTHSKFIFAGFREESLKGKSDEKNWNPRFDVVHHLTIQSSFLQLFEKETLKGIWDEI
jgi:hypothetical protein